MEARGPNQSCRTCGAKLSEDSPVCLGCALGNALESTPDQKTVALPGAVFTSEYSGTSSLTRFGDYELLEEIARGGMGIVYKARQITLNRLVAVKMILFGPLASAEMVRRFRTEASAAGCLQHPNIVRIHDVGLQGNQQYFVMDYVDGPSLGHLVRDRPLPAKEAARYVRIIAEAVHYAHERGILHRDLKPSNVLIDSENQPRVVDFGLAKRFTEDSSLTLSGHVLGSPSYMPPEQAGASRVKVGRHSDVYSLGAVLYHLLTGRAPFQAETLPQTLEMVTNNEALSPRLLNPATPSDLETICLKCLEKAPGKRYLTAQALADELARFERDEPIEARPITRLERVGRWCRRKPALAALLVLVHLVGFVGLAGIIWQWRRAEQNAASAETQRQAAEEKQKEALSERAVAVAERGRADLQARKAFDSQQQARRLLYISDINLAQQALRLNNLGKARRLLDRHRPQASEEDLRGWEWRYLWQLTRSSALLTLTNGSAPGFSLSFSPDGTRLAVGWFDGRVELWDVPARRQLRALSEKSSNQGRVAFSPVRNALAATTQPGTVKLYDFDAGHEAILWRADAGPSIVRDLSFSADGAKVLVYAGFPANPNGAPNAALTDLVWVVKASSGEILSRHTAGYSATFHFGAARFSPDGERLYLPEGNSVNYRYSLRSIDLATGQQLWQTEPLRDYGLSGLAISPDGRVLASASGFEDTAIRIWDTANGHQIVRLDGHAAWVSHLEFSKDGRHLVSAATDQTIRIWDTSSWTELNVLRGHSDEVFSLAISGTAKLLASASKDGALTLWNDDGTGVFNGYARLPDDLQVDELLPLSQSRLLLLPAGKPPQFFDFKNNSRSDLPHSLGSSSNVLGFFGTNILCAWNGLDQIAVHKWHNGKFQQLGTVPLSSASRPSGCVYDSARGRLAFAQESAPFSILITSLNAPEKQLALKANARGLIPVRFSPDGKHLFAAARNQEVRQAWDEVQAWNIQSGQVAISLNGVIRDATFAAGGQILAVSRSLGPEHELLFFELAQPNRPPRRISGKGEVFSLAAACDGALVACSTTRGEVQFFDPLKGELIESIHGHLHSAFGLSFSPDGRILISASGGREAVKLWDVSTRQELLTLEGTGSLLSRVTWSPEGDLLVAGTPWQAWRAPSWEEIAAVEQQEHR